MPKDSHVHDGKRRLVSVHWMVEMHTHTFDFGGPGIDYITLREVGGMTSSPVSVFARRNPPDGAWGKVYELRDEFVDHDMQEILSILWFNGR